MSLRFRVFLAVGGLILLCFSCGVGAYLLWPMDNQRVQDPVAPTLLIPPI